MRRSPQEKSEFLIVASARMQAQPTEAELALKELLRPMGFQFQVPIEGKTKNGGYWYYILDAYHPELKLCVEVDGGVHKRTKGRDRRRDTRLAGEGIRTIRYTNLDVLKKTEQVMLDLAREMEKR